MLFLHDHRLLLVCIIAALVSLLTTSTGAARVAGVLTKRIATSLSVYNLFMLIGRLANLAYVPVMGSIVDLAVKTNQLDILQAKIRCIIGFSALGSLIGFLLLPTFVEIYVKAIQGTEKSGSLWRVVLSLLLPKNLGKLISCFRKPGILGLKSLSLNGVPWGFLVFNVFMAGIWTVGVLCAGFASAIVPEYARTATLLSGIVNGFATIMFTLIVDPTASLITDQAAMGRKTLDQVKVMVVYLTFGNVAGAVLGQLFFSPGAAFIAWVTKLICQ